MPEISIIIPVYNLEQYIAKCVESCIHQTFGSIEIICVNDGSKDRSLSKLEELAVSDPRIRIIDTLNQGVVRAREAGIAQATGDYITFIDGDDYISPDAMETLYRLAVENDADMVNGAIVKMTPDEKILLINRGDQIQNQEEFIRTAFQNDDFYSPARLFRRTLFEQRTLTCPPEITHNEDVIMVLSLAFNAKIIVSCSAEVYYYVYRKSSVSNSFSEKQYQHVLAVRRMVWKFFRENGLWERHQSEILFFMINALANVLRYGNPKILLPEDFKALSLRNFFFGNVRQLLKKYKSKPDYRWTFVICLSPKIFAWCITFFRQDVNNFFST
jgi:glycosyltransferase involved in cell wall biosynthesis